jgi:hypothetical protein
MSPLRDISKLSKMEDQHKYQLQQDTKSDEMSHFALCGPAGLGRHGSGLED